MYVTESASPAQRCRPPLSHAAHKPFKCSISILTPIPINTNPPIRFTAGSEIRFICLCVWNPRNTPERLARKTTTGTTVQISSKETSIIFKLIPTAKASMLTANPIKRRDFQSNIECTLS